MDCWLEMKIFGNIVFFMLSMSMMILLCAAVIVIFFHYLYLYFFVVISRGMTSDRKVNIIDDCRGCQLMIALGNAQYAV